MKNKFAFGAVKCETFDSFQKPCTFGFVYNIQLPLVFKFCVLLQISSVQYKKYASERKSYCWKISNSKATTG